MRRKNDILWKGMLEEVFEDFLRFMFPNAEKIFNLKRGFVFLDKELSEMHPEPDKNSDTRFVDKLVKVFTRDGKEKYLLVHVEVQGRQDPDFAKRMFKYFYRIFDKYDRLVIPVAIYTGRDGKKMPDRYALTYAGLELMYRFNTLYITDYDDKVLAASDNPFALVLLAAKKALLTGKNLDAKLLKEKILIVRLLLEKGIFTKRKIQFILSFLNNYVLFEKAETNRIFNRQVDKITGKKNTMGIIEQLAEIREQRGIAKGERRATRLFVLNLLKDSDFPVKKIASLANVSVDFVNKIKKGLLTK